MSNECLYDSQQLTSWRRVFHDQIKRRFMRRQVDSEFIFFMRQRPMCERRCEEFDHVDEVEEPPNGFTVQPFIPRQFQRRKLDVERVDAEI